MARWSNRVKNLEEEIIALWPRYKGPITSKSHLFSWARNEGLITEEEYADAKNYYGRLFNYCGD